MPSLSSTVPPTSPSSRHHAWDPLHLEQQAEPLAVLALFEDVLQFAVGRQVPIPDYDLDDLRILSSPQELRAGFDPLRSTILELLLERAATGELAAAVERPKSSVAYHVGVLVDAGLLKVVRTRNVRAIQERFYGRTADHQPASHSRRRVRTGAPGRRAAGDDPLRPDL